MRFIDIKLKALTLEQIVQPRRVSFRHKLQHNYPNIIVSINENLLEVFRWEVPLWINSELLESLIKAKVAHQAISFIELKPRFINQAIILCVHFTPKSRFMTTKQ